MKSTLKQTLRYAVVFLVGFLIVPGYCFLSYHVKEIDDQGLLLLKKENSYSLPNVFRKFQADSGESSLTSSACARNRWLIKTAIIDSNQRSRKMSILDLFELIRKKKLKEMPNCPSNGTYAIKTYAQERPVISCTLHGLTEAKSASGSA